MEGNFIYADISCLYKISIHLDYIHVCVCVCVIQMDGNYIQSKYMNPKRSTFSFKCPIHAVKQAFDFLKVCIRNVHQSTVETFF